jgi:nucleoporin NUP82
MPKVKSYSAPWLSGNAPGRQLFAPADDAPRNTSLSSPSKASLPGPRRTIARRGTQVFVASGREIRWGDLAYLKEQWANGQARESKGRSTGRPGGIKREDSYEDDEDFEDAAGIRVSERLAPPCNFTS